MLLEKNKNTEMTKLSYTYDYKRRLNYSVNSDLFLNLVMIQRPWTRKKIM